jgi:hypothetical protein
MIKLSLSTTITESSNDQQQLHNQFTLQYTSAPLSSLSPHSCYIVLRMTNSLSNQSCISRWK